MIKDQLKNAELYSALSRRFAVAFEYISTTNLSTLENGRHEILGSEVYAAISEYQTKPESEAKWESHKKYADIQIVISGEEKMGYAPLDTMKIKDEYNAEKDITILTGSGEYVVAQPGSFVVFMPHDAHQPGVSIGAGSAIKKVVLKVMV